VQLRSLQVPIEPNVFDMTAPIPIHLVTGFLGSGKTTFLKRVLHTYPKNQRIGVVQNEFAPAHVDAPEIHSAATPGSYRLLEINNGSIFCVCLLGTFLDALKDFAKTYQPDVIFVETSGLSDPIAVAEVFNTNSENPEFFLKSSICIVDALNFLRLSGFQRQLCNQIRIADHLLINKTDQVEDAELDPIRKRLRELNPFAPIETAVRCEMDCLLLLSPVQHSACPTELSSDGCMDSAAPPLSLRSSLHSVALRSQRPLSAPQLEPFLHRICSESIRAKGVLCVEDAAGFSFQSVCGQFSNHPLTAPTQQSLIVTISKTLTYSKLENLYLSYSANA